MPLPIGNLVTFVLSGLMEYPWDAAMLLSIVAVSLGICNGSTLKYVHAIKAERGFGMGCQDANAGDNVRQLPMSGRGQGAGRTRRRGEARTPKRVASMGGWGSAQVRVSSYEQHISVSAHEMLWKRSIFKMQNVVQNVNRVGERADTQEKRY